jgi:hypothetical protein
VGRSENVDHIWRKSDGVLHFISNALAYTAGKADLREMAESMIMIPKPGSG